MAVDGSLIFDTKIDTGGVVKGEKDISSKMINIMSKMTETQKKAKALRDELAAMAGTKVKTKAAEKLENDIAKTKEKLTGLKADLKDMTTEKQQWAIAGELDDIMQKSLETRTAMRELEESGQTGSLEYRALSESMKVYVDRIADLNQKLDDLERKDNVTKQSTEYKKLEEQIQSTKAQLQSYEDELKQVEASAPGAEETAAFHQKKAALEQLSLEFAKYEAQLREAEQAEESEASKTSGASQNTSAFRRHLQRTISALKMVGKGAAKAGNLLKSAFSKAAGKLIQNIGSHFKRTGKQTNVLEKSLKRIKNTLVRMFFFRLVHSPIDAIKDGLGEIAKISPALNKNLSALKTESTYLKNSLAALAAPLVNLVTPAFVSFMQTISGVLNKTGQLLAVLTGQSGFTQAVKVQQDYAESLDESTKSTEKNTKATKENQKALAGFDELNVLDVSEEDSSDEGTDATTPMFENVEAEVSGLSKKLLDFFKNQDFEGLGTLIGEKISDALKKINWRKIKSTVRGWAKNIADFFNGFIKGTDWEVVGKTIANGIGTALAFAQTLIRRFNFDNLGTAIGNLINGFLSPENAAIFADTASRLLSGIFAAVTNAVKTINWGRVSDTIISFITNFKPANVSRGAVNLLNSISGALRKLDFKQIGEAFRAGLAKINWKNIWNGVTRLFGNALQGVIDFFGLKGVNTSKLKKAMQDIYKPVSELYQTLKNTANELLAPIVNDFLPECVNVIGSIFKAVKPVISAVTPVLKKVIEVAAKIVKSLAPMVETIGETVGKMVDSLSPLITPLLDFIGELVKRLAPAVQFIFECVGKIFELIKPINEIIGGIFAWLVGDNGTGTTSVSAKLQEELDHLSGVSENLDIISENIDGALAAVDENLQSTAGDLKYIDDLKGRMEELLKKSTLSDADMKELNTIADLITEKLPEFEKTWDSMTTIDANGKLAFTTNRENIIKSIDDVITKLKEQYATEALQEQYKEAYKAKTEAAQDYNTALLEVAGAQDKLNQLGEEMTAKSKEAAQAEKDWWDGKINAETYNKKIEAAKQARAEYDEYKKTFEVLEEKALKAGGKLGEANKKLEGLSTTMNVLKTDGDGLYNSLQDLRTAFDYGLIDMDTITKNTGKNAKELFAQTKGLAEQSAAGYEKGVEESAEQLKKSGVKIATDAINGAREGFDSHSPSKKFIEIGEDSVEGLEVGFNNRTPKILALIKKLAASMTEAMRSGLTNVGKVFDVLPGMVKSKLNLILTDFNTFINRFISGINQTFEQINAINKAFADSGGGNKTYTTWSPVKAIYIPKLATGAYVPANYGEFLAVLGDNKREPEVVSPISDIKQAVLEALAERGGSGDQPQEINLYIDGDKFFTWLIGKNNQYQKSHGQSAFKEVRA